MKAQIATVLLALPLLMEARPLQAADTTPNTEVSAPATAPPATPTIEPATTDSTASTQSSSTKKGKKRKNGSLDGSASAPDKLKVSGYIQFYYKTRVERSGDGAVEPDVFRFGRVQVQFSGEVQPKLRYVVEIDPRSPQIAGVMRDCYLQWEFHPGQRLRFGQMKTPFGWENRTSSSDLFTVNRTEVGELFGRGLTLRDSGLGWFGRVPLGEGFRIENEVTVTNGAGLSAQADDDHRKNVFGRLGGRWKTKPVTVSLGLSGATGTMNEPIDPEAPDEPQLSFEFTRFGTDMEFDTRRAFTVVEFAQGNEKANVPDEGGTLSAWYLLVAGKTRWDAGPVVRYDVFDSDSHRWTLGGYYGPPGQDFRAMVTYEVVTEDEFRHDDRVLVWTQLRF